MKKVRIAVLDSGVRQDHPAFSSKSMDGFSLCVTDGVVEKHSDFSDQVGHGTAVYYLIETLAPDAEITNIRVYRQNAPPTQSDFELMLSYIYEHFDFDVINISMGFIVCGCVASLQQICDRFREKGTLIISAFDNNGAVSFPAALQNVIGVDGQEDVPSSDEYIYVENSIVNIIGKLRNVRVAWTHPDYILVRGNSFVCAELTARVAEQLSRRQSDFDLRKMCAKTHVFSPPADNSLPFVIRKAAVFPFNKEIHALARYESILPFEITHYYAPRISGYVGRRISDLLPDCHNNKIIENIDDIKHEDFDTLIVGHTGALSRLTGRDYLAKLLQFASDNDINVYCFDHIDERAHLPDKQWYYPRCSAANIHKRFGKLYKTDKPVLAVVGTGPQQGKFSLQLYLRKKLTERGYLVGQLGTEPSAPLFGMDEVFHCGYNGQIELDIPQMHVAINDMIWRITQKDPDLIIAGGQSGLIPYNDYNAMMCTTVNQIFVSAVQPDAVIVCINPFDTAEFVDRTVRTAEGLCAGKVLGLVCFPIDISEGWRGRFGTRQRITPEKEQSIKRRYTSEQMGVYMLDRPDELDALTDECIRYFRRRE